MVDAPGRAPIAPTVVGAQILPETQLVCPLAQEQLSLRPNLTYILLNGAGVPNPTGLHTTTAVRCSSQLLGKCNSTLVYALGDVVQGRQGNKRAAPWTNDGSTGHATAHYIIHSCELRKRALVQRI